RGRTAVRPALALPVAKRRRLRGPRARRGSLARPRWEGRREALLRQGLGGQSRRSVPVQLDRVAVRIPEVNRVAPAAAGGAPARARDPSLSRPPAPRRHELPEVVAPAGLRIELTARHDEIEDVPAARALQEEHALVRERDAQSEDVDVEALRHAEVSSPERDV